MCAAIIPVVLIFLFLVWAYLNPPRDLRSEEELLQEEFERLRQEVEEAIEVLWQAQVRIQAALDADRPADT